jgi:hypothetical protein
MVARSIVFKYCDGNLEVVQPSVTYIILTTGNLKVKMSVQVASNGIKPKSNLIEIHPVVLKMNHSNR